MAKESLLSRWLTRLCQISWPYERRINSDLLNFIFSWEVGFWNYSFVNNLLILFVLVCYKLNEIWTKKCILSILNSIIHFSIWGHYSPLYRTSWPYLNFCDPYSAYVPTTTDEWHIEKYSSVSLDNETRISIKKKRRYAITELSIYSVPMNSHSCLSWWGPW